jgi:hypothetical protein
MGQAFAAASRRSFRLAEHSRIKLAISRANISRNIRCAKRRSAWRRFSAAVVELPLFLLVERPGEHALNGGVTLFQRGWCHTHFSHFKPSLHGVQRVILDGVFWRVDG